MPLATFYKQPYEKYSISADFSMNMESSETIVSESITAVDNAGDSATVDILASPSNDGSHAALVRVQNGTQLLSPYKITFRIVTSTAAQWELDVIMKVKEL